MNKSNLKESKVISIELLRLKKLLNDKEFQKKEVKKRLKELEKYSAKIW